MVQNQMVELLPIKCLRIHPILARAMYKRLDRRTRSSIIVRKVVRIPEPTIVLQ